MGEEGMMNVSVKTEKGKEKEMPKWKEEKEEAEARVRAWKNPSAGSREGNREDECMVTRMINAIGKDDRKGAREKKNHTFGWSQEIGKQRIWRKVGAQKRSSQSCLLYTSDAADE